MRSTRSRPISQASSWRSELRRRGAFGEKQRGRLVRPRSAGRTSTQGPFPAHCAFDFLVAFKPALGGMPSLGSYLEASTGLSRLGHRALDECALRFG